MHYWNFLGGPLDTDGYPSQKFGIVESVSIPWFLMCHPESLSWISDRQDFLYVKGYKRVTATNKTD